MISNKFVFAFVSIQGIEKNKKNQVKDKITKRKQYPGRNKESNEFSQVIPHLHALKEVVPPL